MPESESQLIQTLNGVFWNQVHCHISMRECWGASRLPGAREMGHYVFPGRVIYVTFETLMSQRFK